MNTFFQLVSDLLISSSGSLVYHLVILFSIVAGLQMCILFMDINRSEWSRMLLGFCLLLSIQLIMFIFAALAWQGLFDPGLWLPLIEKSASLLSLIIIIWLWSFPIPARIADTAFILLGFLILALTVFSGAYLSNSAEQSVISLLWLDKIFTILGVIFASLGVGSLIHRKPSGWETGLGQLTILCIGYLTHLLWGGNASIYPALIRLAELAAFPLLIALPQRYLERSGERGVYHKLPDQNELFEAIGAVLSKPSPELIGIGITQKLATLFKADISILLEVDQVNQDLKIHNAYDHRNNREIILPSLIQEEVPLLIKSIHENKILHFTESSKDTELIEWLKIEAPCNLMFIPITKHPHYQMGLLLISMNGKHKWHQHQEILIQNVASLLVYFLHLSKQSDIKQQKLDEIEDRLLAIQASTSEELRKQDALLLENQELRQLEMNKKSQIETLAVMISMQQESLTHSNARIQSLERELENRRIGFNQTQLDDLAFQLDELKRPIHSIQEHTGFLLGESMGVLGSIQRKFVERIRIASERAAQISEDLLETLKVTQSHQQKEFGAVDLGDLVDVAVSEALEKIKQKHIRLRMDLPDQLPSLVSNEDALRSVLVDLLVYAGKVTPTQGEVYLNAHLEEDNGRVDYVILQITDSGDGIPAADLPNVFSPNYRIKIVDEQQVGSEEIDLSNIYNLVLSLNGRIWIDNEPGKGSTVSLLIPADRGENDHPGESL
jgi:signal transduction histidine kinase